MDTTTITNTITNAATALTTTPHETASNFWEVVLSVSTFGLAVFTALMAWATFRLGRDSRKASQDQISAWENSTAAQIKTWERNSKNQIGVQTWLTMEERFDSEEMKQHRALLAKEMQVYDASKHHLISEEVLELFESIGIVHRLGMINEELAECSFAFYATHWWEAAKKYVANERKRHNNDMRLYCEFEKYAEILRHKEGPITEHDLKLFLDDEEHGLASTLLKQKREFSIFLRRWRSEVESCKPQTGSYELGAVAAYNNRIHDFQAELERVRDSFSDKHKFALLAKGINDLQHRNWQAVSARKVIVEAIDKLLSFAT